MGKGKIGDSPPNNGEGGQYNITLLRDMASIEETIAWIDQRTIDIGLDLAKAELAEAEAETQKILDSHLLDDYIDEYRELLKNKKPCLQCSADVCIKCSTDVCTQCGEGGYWRLGSGPCSYLTQEDCEADAPDEVWKFGAAGICHYDTKAECDAANPNWKYGDDGDCIYPTEQACKDAHNPEDVTDKIIKQTETLAASASEWKKATKKVEQLLLERTAIIANRRILFAVEGEIDETVWCADYTEDLDDGLEVGTIEVPGERKRVMLRPGYDDRAKYEGVRDGIIQPTEGSTPATYAYNFATFPGWQKWVPTYRTGIITEIQEEDDTCNVTIDAETSSAQKLDVNAETALVEIPIEYMHCESDAFVVGDHVIIELTGSGSIFDPEDPWMPYLPKVIGFVDHPKFCPISVESGMIELPSGSEDPPIPALLYPLAAQAAQAGKSQDQLLDKMRNDGFFSYRDYAGADSFDSESLPLGVDGSRIVGKRLFELTGKLKYAIQLQAQGLKNGTQASGLLSWVLAKRSGGAPETVNNSYFLYTIEVGLYYLINFAGGLVSARKVEITGKYSYVTKEVQDQISGYSPGEPEYQRYEGYILALVGFSDSDHWEYIGSYEVVGSSFYYGWKPSWGGSSASICTNVEGGVDPVSPGIALPHNAYLWLATISGGGPETFPSVSVSEIRTKEWTPRMEPVPGLVQADIIWHPKELIQSQYWFPHPILAGYANLINVEDVPIYCWYSHENELVVVNYRFDDTAIKEEDHTVAEWRDTWEEEGRASCGGFNETWNEISGGFLGQFYLATDGFAGDVQMYADPGLLGDGFEATAGSIAGSGDRVNEQVSLVSDDGICGTTCLRPAEPSGVFCLHVSTASTNWCGGRAGPPWFDYPDGCMDPAVKPHTHQFYSMVSWSRGLSRHQWDSGSVATECWPAIVIPAGNAESIYLIAATEVHGTVYRNATNSDGIIEISGMGVTYQHKYRGTSQAQWRGCQIGGCGGSYRLWSETPSNVPIDDYVVTRYYADKFGVQEFEEMTDSGWFPESSGGLFVVSPSDPTYAGWFLGIAGTEGPKFWQQHPGGDDFGDFNSNVDKEWVPTQFRMFGGWA